MPITQSQAVMAVQQNGERFTFRDADMSAGAQDGTSLSTGQVGEIGVSQVGSDGQTADYSAVMMGQPPLNPDAAVVGNEGFINPGGSTVNDTTENAIGVKKTGDPGFVQRNNTFGWVPRRTTNTTTNSEKVKFYPTRPIARQGRELIYAIKDESTGPQVSLSSSVVEVPAVGGDI